jgi:DNA primase
MNQWLESALKTSLDLPGQAEGYLLGRGVQEQAIVDLEMGVWRPPDESAPDNLFVKRYGPRGEKLEGHLVYPLRTGKGDLLGFEARSMTEKAVSQFKLDRAFWNPVYLGLRRAMPKIWAGGDIWIGEGMFDMTALDHIVPEKDATLGALTARLTYSQIEFLRRFSQGTVNMVFDRDEKGRKATVGWTDETGKKRWGAIESLDRVEVRCRDVPYRCPVGTKDPGDIWEQHGTAGLRRAFTSVLL